MQSPETGLFMILVNDCGDYVGLEAKEIEKGRGLRKRKSSLLKILTD
jgi:hypothetical protein